MMKSVPPDYRACWGYYPYTRLGMAALLPHKTLTISDDYKVLVDGCTADDLKQRETILKNYVPNSRCVQFDEIRAMKKR